MIKDSLIHGSAEMAIVIIDVQAGKLYHSTLLNNGAPTRITPDRGMRGA